MSDKRYIVLETGKTKMPRSEVKYVTFDDDYTDLDKAYEYAMEYFDKGWGPVIGIIEVDMKTGEVKQIADKEKLYAVEKEQNQ